MHYCKVRLELLILNVDKTKKDLRLKNHLHDGEVDYIIFHCYDHCITLRFE